MCISVLRSVDRFTVCGVDRFTSMWCGVDRFTVCGVDRFMWSADHIPHHLHVTDVWKEGSTKQLKYM